MHILDLLTALQLATASVGLYGGVAAARRARTGSHRDDGVTTTATTHATAGTDTDTDNRCRGRCGAAGGAALAAG